MTPQLLERTERWRVELADAFSQLIPEPLDEHQPDGALSGLRLGQLVTFQVDGTPQVVRRTRAAVRAAPGDPYKICVQVRGRATVHQDGREVVLEPGQMAIYDTGRPYDLRLERQWSCAVLAFPRNALGLPEHLITASMAHAYQLADGPGAVLADFVRSAVRRQGSIPATAASRLGEAGLHLIAGTLSETSATSCADEAADALRLQILAYVRTHLADPDLSHARVAAAHHMAGRTLHRLFEHEPCTVTDYIRTQRLEAVHRDLTDPLLRNRSIATLASRWGFTDQAHFTRAFRARYGTAPSHARRGY
ncbi:helix-turn-helix domain-containing protein [Actinophytocola sp.]|uniref:AraC-like ligand-binding domain-containing protein n=1 Tax=Actinophytocola sp. TaxID=1872138 RepID=UPI002ED03E23